MILLDHLKTIYDLTPAKARKAAIKLYTENATFRRYMDIAYSLKSPWYGLRSVPIEYKKDTVPEGYNFSQLEMQLRQVSNLYQVKSEIGLDRLTLIMEAISEVEGKFLLQVLRGKVSFLSYDQWMKIADVDNVVIQSSN